ncbi:hypothetical protein KFE80_09615 [bacterium SCSIO 12696]|nr:hypothetical protein KFE80_09615 [bacterium SCSIO 12696]
MKLVEEDTTGQVYAHNCRRTKDGKLFFGADRRRGPRRTQRDRRKDIRFEADRRTNAGRRKEDFDMRDYQVKLEIL